MKNWKALLLIAACFAVVGLVDSPDYYSFELKEPVAPRVECDEYLRLFTDHKDCPTCNKKYVDNSVYKSANVVNNPSPIVWR